MINFNVLGFFVMYMQHVVVVLSIYSGTSIKSINPRIRQDDKAGSISWCVARNAKKYRIFQDFERQELDKFNELE